MWVSHDLSLGFTSIFKSLNLHHLSTGHFGYYTWAWSLVWYRVLSNLTGEFWRDFHCGSVFKCMFPSLWFLHFCSIRNPWACRILMCQVTKRLASLIFTAISIIMITAFTVLILGCLMLVLIFSRICQFLRGMFLLSLSCDNCVGGLEPSVVLKIY